MRPLDGIGRHGRLRLLFGRGGDRTVLRDSFSVVPMRTFQPFYPDASGAACCYIVNPTSGLVGGDRIESEITLEKDTHVLITSPSATKVYRSTGAYSESITSITLGENAALEYLPRYVIPFAGSMYRQKTTVAMGAGASLILLDAFTTGRTARHEHLGFREYRSATEIAYCGEPAVTDRFVLEPAADDYGALGFLEASTVCAALYILFPDPSRATRLLSLIRECLDASHDLAGGVSTLPLGGVAARILGSTVHSVENTIFRICSASRKLLYDMDSTALERLVQ